MITCDVVGYSHENGGLGNQLFVVATTLALAKNNNDEAVFPDLLKPEYEYYGKTIFHKLKKGLDKNFVDSYHVEKAYSSTKYEKIQYKKNLCLKGHFCSFKYFESERPYITDILKLPEEMIKNLDNSFSSINYENDVAIHIRRGDYLKNTNYHTNLSMKYYENALGYFSEANNIYVFSDDIEWCKKNVIFKNTKFINTAKDISDLYILSRFKNIVIANSTFSWWAAYLGNLENKKIIAPIEWFGKGRTNDNLLETKDLIPDSWIRI